MRPCPGAANVLVHTRFTGSFDTGRPEERRRTLREDPSRAERPGDRATARVPRSAHVCGQAHPPWCALAACARGAWRGASPLTPWRGASPLAPAWRVGTLLSVSRVLCRIVHSRNWVEFLRSGSYGKVKCVNKLSICAVCAVELCDRTPVRGSALSPRGVGTRTVVSVATNERRNEHENERRYASECTHGDDGPGVRGAVSLFSRRVSRSAAVGYGDRITGLGSRRRPECRRYSRRARDAARRPRCALFVSVSSLSSTVALPRLLFHTATATRPPRRHGRRRGSVGWGWRAPVPPKEHPMCNGETHGLDKAARQCRSHFEARPPTTDSRGAEDDVRA